MSKHKPTDTNQETLKAPELNEIKTLPVQNRLLVCKLTTEEMLEKGSALAKVIQDIDSEEHLQTNTKASMKARMTNLEKERGELTLTISRKQEERLVDVEPMYDYKNGVYMETRLDTGEVIMRRALYDHERQTMMFDADGKHLPKEDVDTEKLNHEEGTATEEAAA